MTSKSFTNMVCQIAHFLGGYAATLTVFIVSPSHWLPVSLVGVLTWAGVKEFWFDPKHEGAPIVWSGIEDFSFYCIGLVIGVLFCLYH